MTEPTPPTPPSPPTPPPAPAWHEGVAPEVKGFWQNKGLPLDDPKAFGTKLTELYQQAEKFIGVPPDRLVRMPAADAKPEDIRAFQQRLGAPAEAKEYDFSVVKDAAGNPLSAPLVDALREAAFDRGLTKDAALTVAQKVVKAIDGIRAAESADQTAKIAEARDKLKQNWGPNFEYNKLKAMDGARKLGISPEAVATLENVIGYADTMEALRKIGVGTSEDTFVDRGTNTNGQVTTREGAIARKAELMADHAWAGRYLKGGAAEVREMTALNMMITGAA
jgi:hypothetical protein